MPDVLVKLGPLHHARRLIAHATEQQRAAAGVQNVCEVLEGVQDRSRRWPSCCVAEE